MATDVELLVGLIFGIGVCVKRRARVTGDEVTGNAGEALLAVSTK